jgi:hypothetical protein
MSDDKFEDLVISRLDQLVTGQTKMWDAFQEHVKDDDKRFNSIEVIAAENAGAAKQRATFWGVGTGFVAAAISGLVEHFWKR